MEAQIERLQEMSETLEGSGFSHQQSNAVIKSVALAMQTFAVTPEVLDQRIDKVMDAVKEQGDAINELRGDINELRGDNKELNTSMNRAFEKRDDDIRNLRKSMNHLEHTMNENHRSALGYMMMFTAIIVTAALGVIVTFITQSP